jgi:hypothetical protein
MTMEPMSLILAALAAGAVAGSQETANSAVKDAYSGLKKVLARHMSARAGDEQACEQTLADLEQNARAAMEPLAAELRERGIGDDPELLAHVRSTLAAFPGVVQQIAISDSQAVQSGPGSSMSGTFNFNPNR